MTSGIDSDPAARPSGSLNTGEALYLYCLARPGLGGFEGAGVDGEHPVNCLPLRNITAVCSVVRVDAFCGAAAEARMRDLQWFGPRACRHEEVIEQVMRVSPLVPARFATLFSSPAALLAWLETHYATICEAIQHFADHQEWAVKATIDRRKAEEPLIAAALARRSPSASPGMRYLEERRIRAGIGQEVSAWLSRLREQLRGELCEYAVDFRERAIASKVSEDEGTPLFNWAFMVASGRIDEFHTCIERLGVTHAEQGLVLDCSGPWPPYSFCPALDSEGIV